MWVLQLRLLIPLNTLPGRPAAVGFIFLPKAFPAAFLSLGLPSPGNRICGTLYHTLTPLVIPRSAGTKPRGLKASGPVPVLAGRISKVRLLPRIAGGGLRGLGRFSEAGRPTRTGKDGLPAGRDEGGVPP